jgi:hypothetical protein
MNPEVRDRAVLPLLVPLIGFGLLMALVLPMSRILIAGG